MTTNLKNMKRPNVHFATAALAAICTLCACDKGNGTLSSVGPEAFQTVLGDRTFLIDVRTPQEYAEGHISDAVNIDFKAGKFAERVESSVPKSVQVAVYCLTGKRSRAAARQLVRNGYNVIDLNTGIDGWTEASKPLSKDPSDVFFTQNGTAIRLYCMGHGSVKMRIADKWIYADPVRMSGQTPADYSKQPKADVILITHEHGDHLDAAAVSQLSSEKTTVIANPNSRKQLGCGESMVPGDSRSLQGGITVTAVPAYNSSEGRQNFHPKGRDNGYLLTVDGFTIYIAGDTEDIPEMKNLPDIDIAFLPCNQPYTMTPEQLASAAGVIRPKVLFPYHYSNTDMTQVTTLLEGSGTDVRIRAYQ